MYTPSIRRALTLVALIGAALALPAHAGVLEVGDDINARIARAKIQRGGGEGGTKVKPVDASQPAGRGGDVHVELGTEKVPAPDAVFVTWTLDDTSPFYCVEPWMGAPNAPGNKVGLHLVPPGQTQRFSVGVSVR